MKKIIAYKGYFNEFVEKLTFDEQQKLRKIFGLLKTEDRIPRHFVKYIREVYMN